MALRGPCSSPLDAGAGEAGGSLPVWDLSDLYASPDDPRLAADLDRAEAEAQGAGGKIRRASCGSVSGDALAEAIADL